MSIDEQAVREWLRSHTVGIQAHTSATAALALLDAKDAETDAWANAAQTWEDNAQDAYRQRDEALSKLERAEQLVEELRLRAETAEVALAELTEQVNEASRATLSYGNQCATAVTKARDLEQALAERDAAMVGIRLRADEWKGTGNCCASTANYVAEPARPFLPKPVEPEPDPLVAIFTEIARGPNRPANEEEEAAAFRQALARSGYEVRKVGEGK